MINLEFKAGNIYSFSSILYNLSINCIGFMKKI